MKGNRRQKAKKGGGKSKGPIRALGSAKTFTNIAPLRPLFTTPSRRLKLFYYDYGHEFTSTAASVARYRYRVNGMFDPDQTGTGHQPMGFDEAMKYYDQFTVLKSKITVRYVAEDADTPMVVGVKLNDDTTNETNTTDIIENGLNRTAICVGTGGGQHQVCELTLACDVARYFGRPEGRNIIDDPNLLGTAAADPVEQAYYQLFAYAAVNTTTVTCGFDVLIEYDAVFWEPRSRVAQEFVDVARNISGLETKEPVLTDVKGPLPPKRKGDGSGRRA